MKTSSIRFTRFAGLASTVLLLAGLSGCGADQGKPRPEPVMPTELAALDTPLPEYPLELACQNISGTVVLKVTVGVEGKPTSVQLAKGSGNAALDKLAQDKVPTWRFRPATRGGQPVAQTIQVPVNFRPPEVRPDQCFALDEKR